MSDLSAMVEKLTELRMEHRALDEAIARLAAASDSDDLQVRRLKKRKLALKDAIRLLESELIPDLDA